MSIHTVTYVDGEGFEWVLEIDEDNQWAALNGCELPVIAVSNPAFDVQVEDLNSYYDDGRDEEGEPPPYWAT